ncbi:MAG: hypothetical protein ACPGUD_00570 [Parashewanella sp.]
MMQKQPITLRFLSVLYILVIAAAIWRFIETKELEMFTIGVLPVLYGLWTRQSWTLIVLRIYLAIQILGVSALGMTGVIAWFISPQDVTVVFKGITIPMLPLVLVIIGLVVFQVWIAFSASSKQYFVRTQ